MGLDRARLADCCKIRPPKSEARKILSENDMVSFIPMNSLGINSKELAFNENKKLSKVSGSYTYFAENDVLLAKITPCFENGKLGVARGLTNGIGFGSSEFIVFRPKDDLLPDYLYYFLLRPEFRESGKKVMTGAVGHKRVPKEYVEDAEILLPPPSQNKNASSPFSTKPLPPLMKRKPRPNKISKTPVSFLIVICSRCLVSGVRDGLIHR